jgi:hypothetical protein
MHKNLKLRQREQREERAGVGARIGEGGVGVGGRALRGRGVKSVVRAVPAYARSDALNISSGRLP